MARTRIPKPTVDFIKQLRAEADLADDPQRRRWAIISMVRSGQHPIFVPAPWDKIAVPVNIRTTADTLRRVVASLTISMPTVAVPPAGIGYKHQENATMREKWTTSLLADMDAAHLPDRPFRQGIDHACTFGVGIWKLVYTPNSWWDYPTAKSMYGKKIDDLSKSEEKRLTESRDMYKRGRVPLAWRAVDPRTWWGFDSEGRLVRCMEITERTVADVQSRYPRANLADLKPADVSRAYVEGQTLPTQQRVKFIEYWDEEWVSYLAEDTMLDQWQHGYGRPPYFRFYGLSDSSKPAGRQGESVVENIIEREVVADSLLTMKHVWAQMSCFPMGKITGPEGSAVEGVSVEGEGERQVGPDITYQSGKFKVFPPGWDADWIAAPEVGTDLNQMIEYLTGELKDVIPNVLRGVGLSDQAGYAINQLITAARLVFDPISDNAAAALQEMVKFTWWMIENKIKEKVYVLGEDPSSTDASEKGKKWLGLGPSDIHNYYACTVNILPLLPSNRIAEGQFGLQAWQAGGIPWRLYLEDFMHVPNPDEIQMERMVEDEVYKGNGSLHQWAVQRAMKLAEMDDLLKQQAEADLMSGVGLPPGIEQRMGMGAGNTPPITAGPGVPAPENLAPQPGLGMPLTPPQGNVPMIPGAPPPAGGGIPGMTGGRAAGVGIQPNTMMLPGGIPGEM